MSHVESHIYGSAIVHHKEKMRGSGDACKRSGDKKIRMGVKHDLQRLFEN